MYPIAPPHHASCPPPADHAPSPPPAHVALSPPPHCCLGRWRYTEWVEWDGTRLRPNWSKNAGVELYDHSGDDESSFDAYENFNVKDQNPKVVAALSRQLHALVKWHAVDATPLVEDGVDVLSFDPATATDAATATGTPAPHTG